MLISIIIPAYRAQPTLTRAVRSALSQSWGDIEIIVVSDDCFDYRPFLQAEGLADQRLRFTSTGKVASGCHNARNAGLDLARGDFIAALDADDIHYPQRLEHLLPRARSIGCASDNPVVVADATGEQLYRVFGPSFGEHVLGAASLLDLSTPLFPLIAREYAEPRIAGVELGEDFVANLRLIDRLGGIPILGETLSEYRVVSGSLAHNDTSAAGFEKSYTTLIERLTTGDKLGLSPTTSEIARECLIQKRDFNRAFASARLNEPTLDFQTFAARSR